MHHTGTGLYDRHLGVLAHIAYQSGRTTGDNEVHQSLGRKEFGRCLACSRQKSDSGWVQPVLEENIMYYGTDGLVAFLGIRTALEDNGRASLQAEGRNIEGNIGTSFVDHADNAKRHADTADVQSVLQHLVTEHTAQGRWQGCHIAAVRCYACYALGGEAQAVVARIGRVHTLQIVGVGRQDGIGTLFQGICHVHEQGIHRLGAKCGKLA